MHPDHYLLDLDYAKKRVRRRRPGIEYVERGRWCRLVAVRTELTGSWREGPVKAGAYIVFRTPRSTVWVSQTEGSKNHPGELVVARLVKFENGSGTLRQGTWEARSFLEWDHSRDIYRLP